MLYVDAETFSTVPISYGTHAYAEQAELLLLPYAFDDDEVTCIDVAAGEQIPPDVIKAMEDTNYIKVIHNSQFDRTLLRHTAGINIPIESIHDTMILAFFNSLPGKLDDLCKLFGLEEMYAKKAGSRLIHLFTKPLGKNRKIDRATQDTHPDDWRQFIEYAKFDVVSMRELYKRLPKWELTKEELTLYHIDQYINDRGVNIDLQLVHGALGIADREKKRLKKEILDKSSGIVDSSTRRDKFIELILTEFGIALPDLKRATLLKLLSEDIPDELAWYINNRIDTTNTSVAKYKKFLNGASADGRLRGMNQHAGAMRTRRDSGRVVQLHNLPRPRHKWSEIEESLDYIRAGILDCVRDDSMAMLASSIRSVICAPAGHKLVISDLANIEGRDGAWFAGEGWLLDAFRAYDNGTGPDTYKMTYATVFGKDPADVSSSERQVGKVLTLAFQYGGGFGALAAMSDVYKIDLEDMGNLAWPLIDAGIRKEAEGFIHWWTTKAKKRLPIDRDTFLKLEGIKRAWRDRHPRISNYWGLLESSIRSAIANPARCIVCGHVQVLYTRSGWLRVRLPSGRCLCYPQTRIDDEDNICYMGRHQYTGKWVLIKSWGGKFFENICQAYARDIMMYNQQGMLDEGYNIVLKVHDEIVAEVPDSDSYTHERLSELLIARKPWMGDIPLAAAGFESYVYRKD